MLRTLKHLNAVKTIYFNFKMFPLNEALKIPVFIGYHTKFVTLKGKIHIEAPLKPGMIRFGFGDVGIVDRKYTRTLIEINGTIIFKNTANFGYGSKVSVGKRGILKVGNKFDISAKSTIICFESITIEDDVLFSWDILVMDTDFHKTLNTQTNEINDSVTKPIFLGANTWVGTGAIILKGTVVPANTIIGAASILNKIYDIRENCLVAGNPASIKKENIKKVKI